MVRLAGGGRGLVYATTRASLAWPGAQTGLELSQVRQPRALSRVSGLQILLRGRQVWCVGWLPQVGRRVHGMAAPGRQASARDGCIRWAGMYVGWLPQVGRRVCGMLTPGQ